MSQWWALLRETATSWADHKAARLGAALAYYSIFSLGPLLVIAISVAGLFFDADATRDAVSGQLQNLLGESGAKAINSMLAGAAGHSTAGILSTLLGVGTLLFAAIGVVVQLKDALNTVWDVEAPAGGGIWNFIRTYLVSLAGVLGVGFLLLVSMLLSTALAAIGKFVAPLLPEFVFQVLEFAVSFIVITLLFAMMFKWLPDAQIAWRDVWVGAAVTSLLFDLGKLAIGLYIGKQGLEIDLRSRGVNRHCSHLGLLFGADHFDGRGIHPCLRAPDGVSQGHGGPVPGCKVRRHFRPRA